MFALSALYQLLRGLLVPRLVLVTENLALRQQLLVLHRSSNRPRLRHRDRLFWIPLSQLWRDWRSILVIVKPESAANPTQVLGVKASFQLRIIYRLLKVTKSRRRMEGSLTDRAGIRTSFPDLLNPFCNMVDDEGGDL